MTVQWSWTTEERMFILLNTLGHSFIAYVMPMINIFDKVELTEAEETYLEIDEPWRLK